MTGEQFSQWQLIYQAAIANNAETRRKHRYREIAKAWAASCLCNDCTGDQNG